MWFYEGTSPGTKQKKCVTKVAFQTHEIYHINFRACRFVKVFKRNVKVQEDYCVPFPGEKEKNGKKEREWKCTA